MTATSSRAAVETKLQLAEEVLDLSDRNVQMAMKIFMRGNGDARHLLVRQLENINRIRALLHKIREQATAKKENELFEAGSARWTSAYGYEQVLNALTDGSKSFDPATAMAELTLPLLLDHSSWRTFVEFLRAQLEWPEIDEKQNERLLSTSTRLLPISSRCSAVSSARTSI